MTHDPLGDVAREDTIDMIALCRLFWAHRLLIAASMILFGAGAAVISLTATPLYHAEAVLTPAADSGVSGVGSSLASRFGGLASLAGIDLKGGGSNGQEARALIESRHLVEEFIRRNSLVGEIMPPGDQATLWFAVRTVRDSVVSVNTDDITARTTIAVNWKDPAVAAQWANGLAELANELLRTKAIQDSQRNIEYLRKQIAATNVIELQQVMYGLVQNEMKTLMLANAQPDYAFTVVDPAVAAEARTSPKRKVIVATGLALGFIVAALFVFGRDTVRRYVRQEAARASPPS